MSLDEFQLQLGEFARQYLQDFDSQPIEAGTVLNAAMRSETLKGYPYIRQQTLAILRELTTLPAAYAKMKAKIAALQESDKPLSSQVSGSEWVAEERDRLEKDFEAKRRSTEKTISNCLNILQQIELSKKAQQFALLGSDPLLEAMRAASQKNQEQK